MNVHKTVLRNVLYGLDESIDRVKLRYLLIQSKKISQFHQKAALIRDLLDGLLEQDDVLNSLYLTDKNNGILHHGSDHAEIEMLLESYYKTSDEIVQTVENLKSQIKTTEEIINVVLDSNRNELMLLSLKFSTGLLSMGIGMYIAALYGMNLENFIEELDYGFESIILIGSTLMFILLGFSMNRLKKVGKMTMTGAYREGSLGRKRLY
jgi:magnesium transporter